MTLRYDEKLAEFHLAGSVTGSWCCSWCHTIALSLPAGTGTDPQLMILDRCFSYDDMSKCLPVEKNWRRRCWCVSFAVGHSAGSKIASIIPKRKQAHTLLGTFDSGKQIVNTAFAALSKIIKLHIITFSFSIFCEDLLLCAQRQGREGKSKLDICSVAIIFFYARLHTGQK